MSVSTFEEITKTKPEKSLTVKLKKHAGRNNQGKITDPLPEFVGDNVRRFTFAGEHYEPPPTYFASTGLGSFADEMKAPVIEPGFLTVLSKEPAKIVPPTNSQYPTSGRRLAFAKFITIRSKSS